MPRFNQILLFLSIFFCISTVYHLSSYLTTLSISKPVAPESFVNTISPDEVQQHRISYRLHSPNDIGTPSQFLSCPGYTCPIEISSLPPVVSRSTVFNFTTTVTTDLKLLFVGDSIVQQFAQNFYSSVLLHRGENATKQSRDYIWGGKDGRHAILRSFINGREPLLSGLHVCSSISAPVHGGGAVGYYRLLDLPNKKGEKDYVYCKNEPGWSKTDVDELLNYELRRYSDHEARPLVRANSTLDHDTAQTTWYKSQDSGTVDNAMGTVGKFNAVVLRPPGPGWMKIHEITRERILESIELLHQLFHVDTIILSTLMFNNNVKTLDDWTAMIAVNEMIRDIAHTWGGNTSGVKFVLVQDLSAFTNEILWMNAEHLGYNISSRAEIGSRSMQREVDGSEFLLHRLDMKDWKFNPSIPMVCNTPPICTPRVTLLPNGTSFTHDNLCLMNVTADPSQCFFNRFSRDGMHWCMETIGPRFSASVACLLGCAYNGDTNDKFDKASDDRKGSIMSSVQRCEMECNRRYMSLMPVEEKFDRRTSFYSRSYH